MMESNNIRETMEGESKPILKRVPYVAVALLYAAGITAAGYFFVLGAVLIGALPGSLDIPWLLVFAAAFFILLIRNRVKTVRHDQNPVLK